MTRPKRWPIRSLRSRSRGRLSRTACGSFSLLRRSCYSPVLSNVEANAIAPAFPWRGRTRGAADSSTRRFQPGQSSPRGLNSGLRTRAECDCRVTLPRPRPMPIPLTMSMSMPLTMPLTMPMPISGFRSPGLGLGVVLDIGRGQVDRFGSRSDARAFARKPECLDQVRSLCRQSRVLGSSAIPLPARPRRLDPVRSLCPQSRGAWIESASLCPQSKTAWIQCTSLCPQSKTAWIQRATFAGKAEVLGSSARPLPAKESHSDRAASLCPKRDCTRAQW